MRKLWPVALLALAPALHAAACGSDSESPGGDGGASAGAVGGQIQDFDWAIKVTWTVQGVDVSTACDSVGSSLILLTLSGTEDVGLHSDGMADCHDGTFTFTGLTRLGTGNAPFVEAALIRDGGGTLYQASATATAAPGTVTLAFDFAAPATASSTAVTTVTTTTGGGNGGGGTGGSGNGGSGNGGSGNGGGTTTTSSSQATTTTTSGNGGLTGQGGSSGNGGAGGN